MIKEEDVWIVPGVVVKGNQIRARGVILEDMGPLVGRDDGFDDRDFGDNEAGLEDDDD